jgi:hypothetical protein
MRVVRSRRGTESTARACYRLITCKRHPRGVTTRARCAGDGNPDDTAGFGHGGVASIPCGNGWFPRPFLMERGIVFKTCHRERTIGRPSPKYLVVADAACAAIPSQMLPAGSNSEARETRRQMPASLATSKLPTPSPTPALRPAKPRHSKPAGLATSKSKAPERGPNVQSTPTTKASRIGVPNGRRFSAMRREFQPRACIAARSFLLAG